MGGQKGLSEGRQSGHEPAVTETRLDVLAIGDAVVDVIATAEDDFLIEEGLVKGSMQVLDADGATRLYALMSWLKISPSWSPETWPTKPARPPKAAIPAIVLAAEPPLVSRAWLIRA